MTKPAVIAGLGLALGFWVPIAVAIESAGRTQPQINLTNAESALQEILVQVRVSPLMIEETITALQDEHGMFFIAADDLKKWRVNIGSGSSRQWQGKSYVRLDALPRVQWTFDHVDQALALKLPADSMAPTALTMKSELSATPVKPTPGLFVNYDLLGENGSGVTRASALLELGLFNPLGGGHTDRRNALSTGQYPFHSS